MIARRARSRLFAGTFVLAACAAGSMTVTGEVTEIAPSEAVPTHVTEHHHAEPNTSGDPDKLYVEITSDGEHGSVLRKSAAAGLGTVPYAVAVEDGGDIELHVEVASLTPSRGAIACKVKIFVMRLPQHDLLGIADGGARATGTAQTDTCLSTIGAAIVREKIPVLLERQLEAKY